MPFNLVAYDLLKSSINESVSTLIKDHDLDQSKIEESIAKLPDERRVQAKFLRITCNLLDTLVGKPQEQARILNAAAYYVRDQIAKSYKYASPERSTFYNSLTTALDLKKGNMPERDALLAMYNALEKFIRSHVYTLSNPTKGYLEVQPYAIKDYSVESDIKALSSQLAAWKIQIIDAALEKRLKELADRKPVIPSKGLFSMFSAGSSPVVVAEKSKNLGKVETPEVKEEKRSAATVL